MADDQVQQAVSSSWGSIPQWLTRGIDPGKLQISQGQAAPDQSIASVDVGDPHKITINDREKFLSPGAAPQTLAHELTHVQQNSLHPSVKFAPAAPGPAMYDFGGPQGLINAQKLGKKVTDFSAEQVAAMMQYKTARLNDPRATPVEKAFVTKAVQPYEDQFMALPRTVIAPTGPNDARMSTTAAAPPPPAQTYHETQLVTKPYAGSEMAAQWHSFLPEQRAEAISRMSPAQKTKLAAALGHKVAFVGPGAKQLQKMRNAQHAPTP